MNGDKIKTPHCEGNEPISVATRMRTEGVVVQRNRPSKPQSVFLAVASVRDKRSDVPGSDARDSIDGPASHSRFPTKINWMG